MTGNASPSNQASSGTNNPFNQLLEIMARHKASDLFISVGSPVQMKVNGNMVAITPIEKRLMPQQSEAILRAGINDQQWKRFQEENELNIGYGLKDVGSFRISLFRQRGTAAAVVRYIPGDIPAFDTLGMPAVLKELILQPRGLFLMVGATGVGKTTTLASLIDYRNANRTGHILTLEDPIEFVFRNQLSIVNQRQIGSDTKDLHTALKSALRQAPDCILIGEIRDIEAMAAAIAYAQSGHLVLATLHANNAAHALNRILSFYAPENRTALLADLSTTLKAIVSQRLLHSTDGGRVPAAEVMINTHHVAELIAGGRLSEISDAINNSLTAGSLSFDRSLTRLLRAGRITRDDALQCSDSPTNLLWLLDNHAEELDKHAHSVSGHSPQLTLPDQLQKQVANFSPRKSASTTDAALSSRRTLADMDDGQASEEFPSPAHAPQQRHAAPANGWPRTIQETSATSPAASASTTSDPDKADANPGDPVALPKPAGTSSPDTLTGIFTTDPSRNAPKHGTLPAEPPTVPATEPPSGAAAPAQGASFAEFLIKLE
ncbi:MAG: PilT/PilU family type 4a pilus ATPase [Lautropia sp.]|nr:PilT/PilU family type 4a pilus ATPase [Lautropia sp.]